MDIKQKNVAIALMLGATEENWYPPNKDTGMTGNYYIFPHGRWYPDNVRQHGDSVLKFHSDSNWQIKAIEYIEALGWNVNINGVEVGVYDDNFKHTAQGVSKSYTGRNKTEAIFEALYAFSQFKQPKSTLR